MIKEIGIERKSRSRQRDTRVGQISLAGAMLRCLPGILTLICVCSCATPMSKDAYMEKYKTFITEVGDKYKTCTETEWTKTAERYDRFTGEWYNKFSDDFTAVEKITLTRYQVQFNIYRAARTTKSVINVLIGEQNVDKIKEQVRYYIDNNAKDDLRTLYDEAKKAGKEVYDTVTEILIDNGININELGKEK